nr:MAG TPA: hypothetical protein [Caudoviricetes sp.]
MDLLKTAVTAWVAFLYGVVIYAAALTLGLIGAHGISAASQGQGVTILIAVAPAAIGLTVALTHWTPKHSTYLEDHEEASH